LPPTPFFEDGKVDLSSIDLLTDLYVEEELRLAVGKAPSP
jgi:hypothetical protein